ncbi:MAG: hypothetical protein QHH13_01495 [Melioribacter sp.]|uniref:surface-adhesin E family protein n=1 Tax=Rosettibacter primus TaxID=3111523 RepID=UPI00247DA08A|nr:hypothetical protein [Melioribacter sp.]
MKFIYTTLFILYVITINTPSQVLQEDWIELKTKGNEKVFINSSNIIISNDDIYVWVLENHLKPISMEMIDKEIYKTKTYYLLNKELKRYSILQIIYYDKNNNVIKSYSYNYNDNDINYKYSTPILEGSTVESILLKCLELPSNK